MFYNLIFIVPFFIINLNQRICFSNFCKNKYNFLLKFEEEDFNIEDNFFNLSESLTLLSSSIKNFFKSFFNRNRNSFFTFSLTVFALDEFKNF